MGRPGNAHQRLQISNASGSVNGHPILTIEDSPYVNPYGIAFGLGENAIMPGKVGVVKLEVTDITGVLYQDSDDNAYASAVFSPSWFDSSLVYGTTDYTVIYYLPPGVEPDEPKYHYPSSNFPDEPFSEMSADGRVMYTWHTNNANSYTQYLFGASFPKTYIPEESIVTPGFFEVMLDKLGISVDDLIGFGICGGIVVAFFGIGALSAASARNRKLKYLPPKISIAGHGIKRGLTAVEAGILLEQPLDKIMMMILFGVIRKDAASVKSRNPLQLDVADPLPEGLREYEKDFLMAFKESKKAAQKKELQRMFVKLVKNVGKKMKGFSKRETMDYYEKINKKAWDMIEKANTPEVLSEEYNKVMEWTMLDDEYEDKTKRVFQNRPVFVPIWWHRYSPVRTSAAPSLSKSAGHSFGSTPGGKQVASMPTLPGADFAAGLLGGSQDLAANTIGNLRDFTGGVTKVTNPVPKSSYSGRSGGGGSSCACACACAGCACACAGGGR